MVFLVELLEGDAGPQVPFGAVEGPECRRTVVAPSSRRRYNRLPVGVAADVERPKVPAHPIHRRYYAEELVRARRASERRRQVASQRRARVDPNPHQIDAVMFALRRIPEGGCILADEVGLGKTIEAGLVIAQLMAEGAERILIVLPRPLLGQWQSELYSLFGIEAVEAADPEVDLEAPGVFLAGREYAGGARGFKRLRNAPPFDLCLIDEAHEVFAAIHRRFDRSGVYDEDSRYAQVAHRLRQVIGVAPVLLLTATPIQNSLAELWGLVQYIDRTGTLLGSKPVFEDVFCADDRGRQVVAEQAEELRRRLGVVVQRTLRRQAQEFLDQPFVGRQAQLFEYTMSAEERSLYDDVTAYLVEPTLHAFSGSSRQLLLLGFHRRMASSTAALADSLERVSERLRRMLGDGTAADGAAEMSAAADPFAGDLEEEETEKETGGGADPQSNAGVDPGDDPDFDIAGVQAELERVDDFVRRARRLPRDSKAESLLEAVRLILERPEDRQKAVVFTESLTTQDYLRDLLLEHAGLSECDITLFRGVNDSARAAEALRVWREEVECDIEPRLRPSPAVAVRLALVHEFRTRSRVFISSEAGAKGLNLQFCDTLVNYDLPWNPQRIEQRIGRCHRYGQKRDVTVINFLARDNEAQRLVHEILSTKLDLFGAVLDMSDVVLQTPRSDSSDELASALGPDFEAQMRRIWDRSRSVREVEDELRRLRDELEEQRQRLDRVRERTTSLIERRFDESVREVFRDIESELPATLAALDAELERVVTAYLDALGVPWGAAEREGRRVIHVGASLRLPGPLAGGVSVALGPACDLGDTESLHLAHPLIGAAVKEARTAGSGAFRVRFDLAAGAPEALRRQRGRRGRLALTRVTNVRFEREDRLCVTAVFEDAEVLRPAAAALDLLRQPCVDAGEFSPPLGVTAADLDEVVDEELFLEQAGAAGDDQVNFEAAMDQLDQYLADRLLVLRRDRGRESDRLAAAERRRDGAIGAENRARAQAETQAIAQRIESLDAQIEDLETGDDETYRRWRKHAHDRRYCQPRTERLLTAEFVIE